MKSLTRVWSRITTRIKKTPSTKSAFTLIELLVVISIIGIMAAIALVSFTGAQRQARDSQRKSDIEQYQAYLESYANPRNGYYPIHTTSTSLVSVCQTELNAPVCPEDTASGQTYRYQSNIDGSKYVIWSTLEGSGQYWTGCSNGRVGEVSSATSNGDCPVADISSTPTPAETSTPTQTPTPSVTPSPTPAPFPCSDGMLGNGCFEDSLPAPWIGISGNASIVTTQFHTGTHGLQIVQPSSGQSRVRQIQPVVAGQNYSMSGWMKTSLTSGNAQILVYWLDSGGSPLQTSIVANLTGTTNWTQYSTNMTPPTGVVNAQFQVAVLNGPGGTAWFDDLSLQ